MSRAELPNRRAQESFEFEYQGIGYTMSLGRFENGPLAEVFVECAKSTSDYESLARDSAVIISIALQHGVPLQIMRSAVTRLNGGRPASLTGRMLDEMARTG